ncbi:T9SS type B sorting domain-containing protein [Arenibacter palladensis]|uniref:T9SS type B sorting domain-containing protein n=1 Tax=Arenibacter palladensis TaxID=237373 RepID=UPI002FD4153B
MRKQLLYITIALWGLFSYAQLECPEMVSPENGATNIPAATRISWTETALASGYLLTLGTSPTSDDILSKTIYMVNYSEEISFPTNSTIYVTITPFNDKEIASGCPKWSFSTIQECGHYINSIPDITVCYSENGETGGIGTDFTNIEQELIGGQQDLLVNYYDGDGNELDLNQLNPSPNSNQFYIQARATDALGCFKETSFNLLFANPPEVDFLEDVLVCNAYTLPQLSANNDYYTGTNGTGNKLQAGDIITKNQLLYILSGSSLCQEESSFRITLDSNICEYQENIGLYPKFFTPNGDGINDFWQLDKVNLPVNPKSQVRIFNRYGKLVHQLALESPGWDGNYAGSPLPASDYWFVVQLENNTNLSGHFTLKR